VVTGVVYAVMRYILQPAEEWAVVNHPWQPHFQHIHVLVAPALVFAIGLIWQSHVLAKFRNGRKGRMTGLVLLGAFVPMVASGYAVQITVSEVWRSGWIVAHLVTSGLWVLVFAAHMVSKWAKQEKKPPGVNGAS
jgi:hypothetical protein